MAFKTLEFVLASAVLDDGTVASIAYPSGTVAGQFTGANASATGRAIINNNDVWLESAAKITITYGATITLTNKSDTTWAAGSEVILELGYQDASDDANYLDGDTPSGPNVVYIPDATAYTCLAANSGKLHIFPDFTATCTIDLPAPVAGMDYTFVSAARVADAANVVIDTQADVNFFLGSVYHQDTDGGTMAVVSPDGNSNSKLTLVTPSGGTKVRVIADAINWTIVETHVCSATVPTFADQ
jgi:hypothetical protein